MPGMTMSPSPSMEKGRLASGSVMARGNSSLMGASKDLACSHGSASSWMQQGQCTECQGLHLLQHGRQHSMVIRETACFMGMLNRLDCIEAWPAVTAGYWMRKEGVPEPHICQRDWSSSPAPPLPDSGSGRALGELVHCTGVMAPAELSTHDWKRHRSHQRLTDTALQSSPPRP